MNNKETYLKKKISTGHNGNVYTFHKRLIEARETAGFSQVSAAKKIGVARMTYVDWEKGTRYPTIDTVVKICNALGVDKHWLAYGEKCTNTW